METNELRIIKHSFEIMSHFITPLVRPEEACNTTVLRIGEIGVKPSSGLLTNDILVILIDRNWATARDCPYGLKRFSIFFCGFVKAFLPTW